MIQNRFSYEWQKYPQITPEYEIQFRRWISPIKPAFFKGKTILDVGCGTGRNSIWPLKYGAKKVVAFDDDQIITQVAKENLKSFKNAIIVNSSIYDINFREKFDVVMCIGVLHHLPDPENALKKMFAALKNRGTLILWVYGYEGNENKLPFINATRMVTSRLPLAVVHLLSFIVTFPIFIYLKLFPQTHSYYILISRFKFWHIRSIIFDQLIPQIARYWSKEDVAFLVQDSGFSSLKLNHTNGNSWTAIATK